MERPNRLSLTYLEPKLDPGETSAYRYEVAGILRCSGSDCTLSIGAKIECYGSTVEQAKDAVIKHSRAYVNTFCQLAPYPIKTDSCLYYYSKAILLSDDSLAIPADSTVKYRS